VAFTCLVASSGVPFSAFSAFTGCTILVIIGFLLPAALVWGIFTVKPERYSFPVRWIASLVNLVISSTHGSEEGKQAEEIEAPLLPVMSSLTERQALLCIVVWVCGVFAMVMGLYQAISELT
jgi:hypothetical protein